MCSCCALIVLAAPTVTFTRKQLYNCGFTDTVIKACLPVLAAQHQQQQAEEKDKNRRNEFKLCTLCRKKLFLEQKSMPALCAYSFILARVPQKVADLNRSEKALVISNRHALTRITLLKHRTQTVVMGATAAAPMCSLLKSLLLLLWIGLGIVSWTTRPFFKCHWLIPTTLKRVNCRCTTSLDLQEWKRQNSM